MKTDGIVTQLAAIIGEGQINDGIHSEIEGDE